MTNTIFFFLQFSKISHLIITYLDRYSFSNTYLLSNKYVPSHSNKDFLTRVSYKSFRNVFSFVNTSRIVCMDICLYRNVCHYK